MGDKGSYAMIRKVSLSCEIIEITAFFMKWKNAAAKFTGIDLRGAASIQ